MKVWMWQRLWKFDVTDDVLVALEPIEDAYRLQMRPMLYAGWHWLCPKPNLVLVDRKYLGGME